MLATSSLWSFFSLLLPLQALLQHAAFPLSSPIVVSDLGDCVDLPNEIVCESLDQSFISRFCCLRYIENKESFSQGAKRALAKEQREL